MISELKKLRLSSSLCATGWPFLKGIIEREAINYAQGRVRRALTDVERHGGAGDYEYILGLNFDIGYGIIHQLPENYEIPNAPFDVDIFATWELRLRITRSLDDQLFDRELRGTE